MESYRLLLVKCFERLRTGINFSKTVVCFGVLFYVYLSLIPQDANALPNDYMTACSDRVTSNGFLWRIDDRLKTTQRQDAGSHYYSCQGNLESGDIW
jgi:hypothetical protein